jgi:hypothetical protein
MYALPEAAQALQELRGIVDRVTQMGSPGG